VLIASGHALYGTFVLRICSRPKVATKLIRLDWSDQIGPSRRSNQYGSCSHSGKVSRSNGSFQVVDRFGNVNRPISPITPGSSRIEES
jgi:hypothetical protein